MDITLIKEQRLVLGRQMQQSVQLLQMSAQEMESYLEHLAEENPLIEIRAPKEEIMRPLHAVPQGPDKTRKHVSGRCSVWPTGAKLRDHPRDGT